MALVPSALAAAVLGTDPGAGNIALWICILVLIGGIVLWVATVLMLRGPGDSAAPTPPGGAGSGDASDAD